METNGQEPPDGQALKSLLRQRPEEGWRVVIDDLFPQLLGWLLAALGRQQRELIEDAMQQAVIKAMGRLESFDPSVGRFDAWFATIVRNEAYRLLRRERLQARRPLPDSMITRSTNGDPEPLPKLTLDLLESIDALPPLQQKVVRSDLQGMQSATELARQLGSSASSVYGARHYGLKNLRKELRKRGHE